MPNDWKVFYCALCWQEFEKPEEHATGSWLYTGKGKQRLDKKCKGDIHRSTSASHRKAKFMRQKEALNLDGAEGITVQ